MLYLIREEQDYLRESAFFLECDLNLVRTALRVYKQSYRYSTVGDQQKASYERFLSLLD